MKATILMALLAGSAIASTMPACANRCVAKAISKTECAASDTACLCESEHYIGYIRYCSAKLCGSTGKQQALDSIMQVCDLVWDKDVGEIEEKDNTVSNSFQIQKRSLEEPEIQELEVRGLSFLAKKEKELLKLAKQEEKLLKQELTVEKHLLTQREKIKAVRETLKLKREKFLAKGKLTAEEKEKLLNLRTRIATHKGKITTLKHKKQGIKHSLSDIHSSVSACSSSISSWKSEHNHQTTTSAPSTSASTSYYPTSSPITVIQY